MAYVAGLYTRASQAASDEAARFRQFQTQLDEMSARERAGLYRRDQAAMDQFTAGLKPQSSVVVPDLTLPAAPPMPSDLGGKPGSGGAADSGGAAQANYERDRALEQRKMLANQYNSEVGAFNSLLTDLGKQKYILEQQLSVAPAYQQQSIRDQLSSVEKELNTTMQSGRERVQTIGDLIKTIDENVRIGDYKRANLAVHNTSGLPSAYTPGAMPERPAEPRRDKAQNIPVPDSIDVLPPEYSTGASGAPGTTGAASRAGLAGLPPYVVDTPGARVQPIAPAETQDERYSPFVTKLGLADFFDRQTRGKAVNKIFSTLRSADVSAASDLYREFFGTTADAKEVSSARYFKEKVMLPWFKQNRDRIENDPALAGRAAANPLEFFITENTAYANYPVPKLVVAEFSSAEYQQTSGSPTPVADAVAADAAFAGQTTADGRTDRLGVTPPQTPEGVAAVNPPLDIPTSVPLTGDPARVKAITEYSAKTVANQIATRVPLVGPAVQSAKGQKYMERADLYEVPRAALIAVWGIESDFGKNKRKSPVTGVASEFHVQPAQLDILKRFYTDPQFIAEYNVPPKFTELATKLFAEGVTADTEVDAALLQIKMADILGIAPNLWGAAYQGNAWDVLKLGTPLNTHDAGQDGTKGTTNSDYNMQFATLFNEARVVANTPMTTGTAQPENVSTFNLEKYDREQARVESDFNYAKQTAAQARTTAVAKQQELERRLAIAKQYNRYDEAQKILAEIEGVAANQIAINDKLREVETASALRIEELNLKRTDEYITYATYELLSGRPTAFADMVSRGTGQLVEIRPVANSKLVQVYINNELQTGGGVTTAQARDMFLPRISAAAKEAEAALAQKQLEHEYQVLLKQVEIKGEIAKAVSLEEVKQSAEIQKLLADKSLTFVKEDVDPATNKINLLVFTDKRGNVVEYRMGAETANAQGVVTRPAPEVKVTPYSGVRPPQ